MEEQIKMKDILLPLRKLHGRLYEWKTIKWPWIKKRILNPHTVFLVLTPTHGNLGDHAIAIAEELFLCAKKVSYIEITDKQIEELYKEGFLNVFNGRTILIHGGGNLGTLWFHTEELTRAIISNNKKSKIIALPNTIYYEESGWGEQEKENSRRIYNAHTKLLLFAREQSSYQEMRKLYQNVQLVPDMVFSLDQSSIPSIRKGCILCLRRDKERTRSEEVDSVLHETVARIFGSNVTERDMVVDHRIPVDERGDELKNQYDAFRHAELVITDRLHGMIFSAITGTPCIVINSKSPKVKGCYEWIKNLDYIRFCEEPEKIERIWQELPKEEKRYPVDQLLPLFKPLEDVLQSIEQRR